MNQAISFPNPRTSVLPQKLGSEQRDKGASRPAGARAGLGIRMGSVGRLGSP